MLLQRSDPSWQALSHRRARYVIDVPERRRHFIDFVRAHAEFVEVGAPLAYANKRSCSPLRISGPQGAHCAPILANTISLLSRADIA
jgi:hypothetical protein